MQLYAIDGEGKVISSSQAIKQLDYKCIECQQIVHLRGGLHRQNHFYHTNPNQKCKLSQKSEEHIKVQLYIEKNLPEGECILERRFKEINRIADVAWEAEKVIFEVQCSPITYEEVVARNRDYQKMGYQVFWVLHDERYNKERVTAAEMALSRNEFYYTNINSAGEGIIYDIYTLIEGGFRKCSLSPLKINLNRLFREKERIYFEGGLNYCRRHRHIVWCSEYLSEIKRVEAKHRVRISDRLVYLLYRTLIKPYKLLFQMLLESACK